jgi:hypothetical protein
MTMPWLTAIPGALRLVPRWVWYALAAVLAWHFALTWHARQVTAHDRTVIAARDAQWQARFDQMRQSALAWKGEAEVRAANISTLTRKLNDEENRRIAADADGLRVRGPGAATAAGCRPVDRPALPAAGGQPGAQPGPGAHAAAAVPAGDGLAVVPWDWLVDVVEQADGNRAEVLTWHAWYDQQAAAWETMRQHPPQPTTGTKGTTTNGR